MPPREPEAMLWDILQACDGIVRRTRGVTVERFCEDEDLRLICERLLSNMCEAAASHARARPDLASRIRRIDEIARFRNFVVHAYFLIDPPRLWPIVSEHVPSLREDSMAILRSLSPSDPDVPLEP